MPTPADPRSTTNVRAQPADAEGTVTTARSPSVSDVSVASGFGPPSQAGEVGTLGPHRLVKELGKGGMGAVYAAIDTRLDRRLALKVMLPEFAADADAKSRFLREAKAAAQIKHDNVVTVYEADERDGIPYIAMEFLQGCPLDAYLKKKGRPPLPQVVRIVAEAAAGLKAAHDIGLVHRDIKPANLWLEAPNGRVKVLDFGLAKPLDAESEVTKSGAVVGTPAYMSPEQARGEKVDTRSDLFSLGALMYRLCAGQPPFRGPTTMAVLIALGTEEPPPVRSLNPGVPESLAALIHQLLSKRADARPQSAAEVVERLQAIAADPAASHPQVARATEPQPDVATKAAGEAPTRAKDDRSDDDRRRRDDDDRSRRKRRREDDDNRPVVRPAYTPRRSNAGIIFAIVALLLCIGAVVGVYAYSQNEKANRETEAANAAAKAANAFLTNFEKVKIGDARGRADEALGSGKLATTEDLGKVFKTTSDTKKIVDWGVKIKEGRVLMWHSDESFALVALHPDTDGSVMAKALRNKIGLSIDTGDLSDASFLRRFPPKEPLKGKQPQPGD